MKPTLALAFALSMLVGGCGKSDKSSDGEAKKPAQAKPAAGRTPDTTDTGSRSGVPEKRTTKKPPLPADSSEHQGKHRFSIQLGGKDRESGRAIALDKDGNVVLGGLIAGDVKIGSTELRAGDVDAAVIKLDARGKPVWARNFGGPGVDTVEAVAVDGKNNIVVAGAFADKLVFGDREVGSAGADDAFVARLAPSGRRLWAKRVGGKDVDSFFGAATTATGDVLVTGVFRQSIELEGGTKLTTIGRADALLMDISADGKLRWVKVLASDADDYGRALAVAGDGSIYWLAEFSREAHIGKLAVQSAGNRDAVVVKLSAAGEPLWARSFGGVMDELAVSLAIDPAGDLVIGGSFDDKIDFDDGVTIESAGTSDAFVVKLDGETGKALWARAYGSKRKDIGSAVAVDGFGNVLLTGWFWSKVDFGGGPLESNGEKDIFAVKLSPAGDYLWSKHFGGKQVDYSRGAAFDKDGNALLTGTFYLTANFGGKDLKAEWKGKKVPTGDMFVVSLGP